MGAPQFFVGQAAELTPDRAVVRGDDARHAATVLRLRVGERVLVGDGRGRVAEAVTTAVAPSAVHADVEHIRFDAPPRPALQVVVGLLKPAKLDLAVQKLTELGVTRILPAVCERSVVRWDARKSAAAVDRWQSIARGAAKQSHRAHLPAVTPVAPLADQVRHAGGHVLVCWEESSRPLRATLPPEPPETLTVVVGPEGGLTDGEVTACAQAGGVDVSLGGLILRAETAMIAVTAALGFHYGSLG